MSTHDDVDLGHTVAGWVGTATALAGLTGAAASLCAGSAVGIAAGGAVVAAGGLLTWVLHLEGWGKPSGPRPPEAWNWRVRDTAAADGHPECLGCRLAGRRGTPSEAPVPDVSLPRPGGLRDGLSEGRTVLQRV